MSNVVEMPTKSEIIAQKIRSSIAGMKQADSEWRLHAISLCMQVATAKKLYPSNKSFGAWWDAQDFGLNADTRAALVAMGQDIEQARKVLSATESRSIQLVYRKEFHLRNATKTETKKAKTPLAVQNLQELLRQEENGVPLPDPTESAVLTRLREFDESCHKNGKIRAGQVALLIQQELEKRSEAKEPPPVDPNELPMDLKAKYDLAVAQMQKKVMKEFDNKVKQLQDGFHEALKKETRKFNDTMHPHWKRQIEFAANFERRTPEDRYPFTRTQYRELKFFTHPDKVASELKDRAASIFTLLAEKEKALVKPEAPKITGDVFPETAEELWKFANNKKK
jgi:hypothetical protein